MAYNNIFLSAPDPLLGGGSPGGINISDYIQDLQEKQDMLEKQKQALLTQANQQQHTAALGAKPSAKPLIWDEVDKEIADLTDSEFQVMSETEEFQQNQNTIMAVMNAEYMCMMRPIVEQSADGKAAIEKQLAFVRSFKKEAKERAGERDALMNDYLTNHSDIPFNEYMEQRAKKQPSKPKKQNRNGSKE